MQLKRPATHILLGVGVWLAAFNIASAEVIQSFNSDIELLNDGSFIVSEAILYDFEGAERHGIFRNISNKHAQESSSWYKKRIIELELISVTMDGGQVPYVIEPYEGLSVRIGDPDKTISNVHEYIIRYKVDGAIATYDGKNEIYWNVTGDEWTVDILSASATLRGNRDIYGNARSCYSGYESNSTFCSITGMLNGEFVFSSDHISPGQQLTIANDVFLAEPPRVIEKFSVSWFWIVIVSLWFVTLGNVVYRWRNEYKKDSSIIAQYEPLPDFKPMFSGVLADFRLDSRDISAGIVYLAEQGFITIKRTTDKLLGLVEISDYEITLKRPISETETTFESQLLTLLFKEDSKPGEIVRLSVLRRNTSKLRTNALLIQKLQAAVTKDLKERGYIQSGWQLLKMLIPYYGVFMVAMLVFALFHPAVFLTEIVVIVSIISIIIAGIFSQRYTAKGFEALNHLKGFKEFMSMTDKDRFEFHNAPEKSPEQFMTFLPYAIALGVEKKWTALFDDIQMEPPSWYSSAGTATVFNASTFSHELGAFTGAFSSSSGSSGGGSAGGGSGGGGGGSW